jgi:hypothetical protein
MVMDATTMAEREPLASGLFIALREIEVRVVIDTIPDASHGTSWRAFPRAHGEVEDGTSGNQPT